ncbi:MAG: PAS domain-containing protein [Bacteroidetes bacterium]|nr:PAS domain-containing protein [Bacteroidota bacterium]
MSPKQLKSAISSKAQISELDPDKFPIVGIGASAGGLEALEQFLGYVPENSGIAFVVIQHLDPTQKGMLPELLQRITKMKVFQVKDHMAVKPDCVYVIPPNKTMSILKGVLYLFEPLEARGLRLPIDFFLRSLADDRKERSIGLILSGMGSDGSIGLRAIKEKNGSVMVQEPSNAKFDSMPRNAIDSVLVDIVAPASVLPSRLLEFLKHIPLIKSGLNIDIKDKSSLEKIIILLRTYTGNDFSLYKKNTVYRRIERRMGVHKIEKISSYVQFLQENPKEIDILFKELMIGVTNFFRDPASWEKLKESVLPDIISNMQPGSILRAWVPGCSTGEEAYSLAIVFKEVLEKINSHGGFSLQIFATDLDLDAIEIARKGIFPANIAADVSPERLNRFFLTTEEGYFINTEIRETVVFAQHNLIMHPPFTKIDIISCRNLLIYMEPELQKKLLALFYYSMNPKGIMFLGSSETLGTQSHLFTALDVKLKIFKRAVNNLPTEILDFPTAFSRSKSPTIEKQTPARSIANIQTLADQLLIQHFTPAGILVNDNGDIIYVSGHTGKYLEPAVGKANMNIFAMLREGLRNEFPVAFRKALMKKETVLLHNIKTGTNGGIQIFNVSIQWIEKPDLLSGMLMIIFTDIPEIPESNLQSKKEKQILPVSRQSALEKELKYTREKMQDTLEEMQASQEELKSTNEELQSTNEELQSTNEELTSSKEEMQSMNEELQTLNAELQSKVDDFMRVNNDMKNLLNSTDIATLFLDKELHIRRFTIQSTKIFKLIKSDIGRPITDLVTDLNYPELSADALEVLRTLIFIQKSIPTKDGRWFSIRIMPYRTVDDRIDGVVITFINISDLKKVELKLHETEQMNSLLVNSTSDILIKLSIEGKILEFNPEAENFFGRKRDDVINHHFIQTIIPEKSQNKTATIIKKLLDKLQDGNFKIQVIKANGNIPSVKCYVNILLNNLKMAAGMILSIKK